MTSNYQKIQEKFIDDIVRNGFNTNRDKVEMVLNEVKDTLYSDMSDDEKIAILFTGVNNKLVELRENYPIPGWNVELNTGIISACSYGGLLDVSGRPMARNAIFDTSSSASKLATQTISYALIKEGYYDFDSKAADLYPKYKNLGDLTIGEIMRFAFTFTLDNSKKIENANSVEEAKDNLGEIVLKDRNVYNYTDHGLMLLKEIMEHVTGMTYEQLFDKYIVKKADLKDTFLVVPENRRDLLTGTPNSDFGLNNDMKAIKLGGFSGHSGVQSTSGDLHEFVRNLYTNEDFFLGRYLFHLYKESDCSKNNIDRDGNPDPWRRGTMGNACTVGGSFVNMLSPFDASAYQGSTRTQINAGTFGDTLVTSSILLNPASMGIGRAYAEQEKINRDRAEGKKIKIITEYDFGGKDYVQISPQAILGVGKVVAPLTELTAELSLRLAFLDTLLREKGHTKKVNVEMENRELKKVA